MGGCGWAGSAGSACGDSGSAAWISGGFRSAGAAPRRRPGPRLRAHPAPAGRLAGFSGLGGTMICGLAGSSTSASTCPSGVGRHRDDRGLHRHGDDIVWRRRAQHDLVVAGLQRLVEHDREIAFLSGDRTADHVRADQQVDLGAWRRLAGDHDGAVAFKAHDVEARWHDWSGACLCGRFGLRRARFRGFRRRWSLCGRLRRRQAGILLVGRNCGRLRLRKRRDRAGRLFRRPQHAGCIGNDRRGGDAADQEKHCLVGRNGHYSQPLGPVLASSGPTLFHPERQEKTHRGS